MQDPRSAQADQSRIARSAPRRATRARLAAVESYSRGHVVLLRRDYEKMVEPLDALSAVLARFESFNRLGALYREGGERAFRGWLVSGFLQPVLEWPWRSVVQGESLDLLTLDWADRPVIYIETKTPTEPLRPLHRREMETRLGRWGSIRHLVLTNGHVWERFDQLTPPIEPAATFATGMPSLTFSQLVVPLHASRYLS